MLLPQSNLGRWGVRHRLLGWLRENDWTDALSSTAISMATQDFQIWSQHATTPNPIPSQLAEGQGLGGCFRSTCGLRAARFTAVQWVCKYHTPPSSPNFETDISRFYIIMEDFPDKYAVILWICFPFKVFFFSLFYPWEKRVNTFTQLFIYAFIQGHIQQHMIRSHPKDTHITLFPKPWKGPLRP